MARIAHPLVCLLSLLIFSQFALAQEHKSAQELVQAALDHWRGVSSRGEMSMTIHRPDWERTMRMKIWTRGDDNSLVRVVAPKKDAGNATLLLDDDMWSYSPKINRVIKMPSSMMGQSWMGSDFSNNDISRADDIVTEYNHELLKTEERDGHTVYHVQAVPKEHAAVVWGREVMQIRDDFVLLQQDFYDQDDVLVKQLVTLDIQTMDGRTVAAKQRMNKTEAPQEWTQVEVISMDFNVDLSDRLFTLSNLRNPRE